MFSAKIWDANDGIKTVNIGGESNLDINNPVIDSPVTLYVSTTGNDSNVGSASSPFKTIQAALDYIKPFDIRALVTIQAGAGNFGGFYFGGFDIGSAPAGDGSKVGVVVQGTMTTLDSGTITTGGIINTITDATKNWTVNQFEGMYVEINSGSLRAPIISNTATTLIIANNGAPTTFMSYTIYDWATSITTPVTTPGSLPAVSTSKTCIVGMPIKSNYIINGTYCKYLKIAPSVAAFGVDLRQNATMTIDGCKLSTTTVNSLISLSLGNISVVASVLETNTTGVLFFLGNSTVTPGGASISTSYIRKTGAVGGTGIFIFNASVATSNCFIENFTIAISALNGISRYVDTSSTFSGCVAAIFVQGRGEVVYLSGTGTLMGGSTGNTNGFVVSKGAAINIGSTVVAGATNEITVDGTVSLLSDLRAVVGPPAKLLSSAYGTIVYE